LNENRNETKGETNEEEEEERTSGEIIALIEVISFHFISFVF